MKKKLVWSSCLLALALCFTLPAMAGVAYNNTLPNPSTCCVGWTIGGAGSLVGLVEDAQLFTSATTGAVSQISIDIGFAAGDNLATVGIYQDVAGVPGALIAGSTTGNLVALPAGTSCPACELQVFGTGGALTTGQQYFVEILADNSTWDAWNQNGNGILGTLEQNTGSGWNIFQGSLLGGMEIQTGGSTTPEPSTLLMLGTGLMGALGVVRRKLNL